MLPPSSDEQQESIGRRLDELGVATAPDEIQELRSAHDALQAWLRIAEKLGGDQGTLDALAEST